MDGRPPGNTGCCRLFVVSVFPCLPSPLAPGPSRTASRTCRWPLAPHRAQSRRLPSSPSQVGWPGRPTPAADLGCLRAARQPLGFLSASRKPEERRGRRRGGLCLGLPWQASGNSGRGRGPSPTPRRTLAGNLAVSRRRGRTTHTHTHTHTHIHTHTHTLTPAPPNTDTPPAAQTGQEPETTSKGDGERGRERETARGPHRLPKPRPPHPPPSTVGIHPAPPVDPTPPSPTDTLTRTLSPTLTLWPGGGGWVSPQGAKPKGTFETSAARKSWGPHG